jgi:hypothetical protein
MTAHEDVNQTETNGTEDHSEVEPNSQLSDFGKLMRARFEVAHKYAESALTRNFAARFMAELKGLLDQDWNHYGAVDSLIINSKIPYVNDVLLFAYNQGILTKDEIARTRPAEVSR